MGSLGCTAKPSTWPAWRGTHTQRSHNQEGMEEGALPGQMFCAHVVLSGGPIVSSLAKAEQEQTHLLSQWSPSYQTEREAGRERKRSHPRDSKSKWSIETALLPVNGLA